MARDQAAMEDAVELLRLLGPVQARGMFGGWGLYLHGRIFGLVIEGQLYLKADELTRPDFERAGSRPFAYDGADKVVTTSYWTPPEDVADDARAITPWARRAVEAAERAALRKRPARKKAGSTAERGAAGTSPAAKTPPEKLSAAKTPAAKAPAARTPAAKTPAARTPAARTPAAKAPAAKTPAAKAPAARTPAAKLPAAKTPAPKSRGGKGPAPRARNVMRPQR
jgi:DNA transformation protein and related proteins